MNATHTPGPWMYDRSGANFGGDHPWFVYANDAPEGEKLPATVDTEANARLIAAAPELLAACQAAEQKFRHLIEERIAGLGWFAPEFEQIQSAIARATSEPVTA